MKTKFTAAAVLALSIGLSAGAQAAGYTGTSTDFGRAVSASAADRHVTVAPGTTNVNVNNGDTVEFTVNGASFTWHFDTLQNESVVDLSRIAPQGVNATGVRVYVGPNPLYRG